MSLSHIETNILLDIHNCANKHDNLTNAGARHTQKKHQSMLHKMVDTKKGIQTVGAMLKQKL